MAKKKLKVLQTMTWLAPGGGVDKHVILTVTGLQEEFEFHLAVGREIHHNEFEHIEGFQIHVCPHLERSLKPWKDFRSLIYFYRLIRREKFDIVHTNETKASLISRVAAWLARCPIIIYTLHGVVFNDPMSKLRRKLYIGLERMTLWTNDFMIPVGENALEIYHENKLGRNLPTEVIHSGIDTALFLRLQPTVEERSKARAALGFQDSDLVLINVGRFSFAKAQRYTIDAFAGVKKKIPNAKLLLVGDGEMMDACKEQVNALGLAKDVVFYGFCEEVANVFYLADVNVLTSLREGLPRVVVEASLCKVPTVGFEVEGIREAIPNTWHKYIVPQTDVEGLTLCMEQILADKTVREAYAADAFKLACAGWDYKAVNAAVANVYRRLAGEKGL
ncbi:MAG: glycosyltransferase [Bacteroidia bacterium]